MPDNKPNAYYHVCWPPPRYAGNWFTRFFNLEKLLVRVDANPRKGEYTLDHSTGVFQFSAEDVGADIVLPTNQHMRIVNDPPATLSVEVSHGG